MTDSAPTRTASIAAPPAARPRRLLRSLYRFTRNTLALIGLLALLHPFTFDVTQLISNSMSPTLHGTSAADGDWVLTEKISFLFRNPRRWDIVEFHNEEGLRIMKRIAAFPGESIAIQNSQLLINNQPLPKPPKAAVVKYYPYGNLTGGKPFLVKDGFYVLGDDSVDSEDSRFEGPLAPSKITARAAFILWPPNRIGWVH